MTEEKAVGSIDTILGVRYYSPVWKAFVYKSKKKYYSRSFSTNKYSDAKERAIAWRKAMEIKLARRDPVDSNELKELEATRIEALPGEIWKPIKKYPTYEISNMGRAKSIKNDCLLIPVIHPEQGYAKVTLRRGGRNHCRKISRLVALEFIKNPDPDTLTMVDHIDRNRTNDKAINLRWTDFEGNSRNLTTRSDNKSGVMGVSFDPIGQRWMARIINLEGVNEWKIFSLKKYPDAFDRAVNWRKQKEKEYGYTSGTLPIKRKRESDDVGALAFD